jgi:hypothetical protein
VIIHDYVVIGTEELVPRWIQGHDFDLGIIRFQLSDHLSPYLFRCRMANYKYVDITKRA